MTEPIDMADAPLDDHATVANLVALLTGYSAWNAKTAAVRLDPALYPVMRDLAGTRPAELISATGVIVCALVDRLALAEGRPRDEAWEDCAATLALQSMRKEHNDDG